MQSFPHLVFKTAGMNTCIPLDGVSRRPQIKDMPTNHFDSRDLVAITQLQHGWGLWRDTCDWDRLRACYTTDALMRTTWFDGTASDFLVASQRMASASKGGLQHAISAPVIYGLGKRAVSVTRVVLMVRGEFESVPVDVTCWGRFHDRLVKQDDVWRIQRRIPVYDKDRLDPVRPGDCPRLEATELERFPAHYRHLACMQSRGGATITMDLPEPLSDADRQLMQGDLQWLQGKD